MYYSHEKKQRNTATQTTTDLNKCKPPWKQQTMSSGSHRSTMESNSSDVQTTDPFMEGLFRPPAACDTCFRIMLEWENKGRWFNCWYKKVSWTCFSASIGIKPKYSWCRTLHGWKCADLVTTVTVSSAKFVAHFSGQKSPLGQFQCTQQTQSAALRAGKS